MDPVTLHIPDALIEWGKDPALASRWPRPWAHDIETLLDASRKQDCALTDRETERLMNLTGALVAEALRSGRADLLGGLDLRSAEWIGLSYQFTLADGREVTLGAKGRYSWSEMREVLAQDDPKAAVAFMETCKNLLADSFPSARLTELCKDLPARLCATCGDELDGGIVETDGAAHHQRCWLNMVNPAPLSEKGRSR